MSAFIVSNKTVNNVLGLRSWVDGDIGWEADQFGADLMQMNVEAVNHRYSHHPERAEVPPYRFRRTPPLTRAQQVQGVKSAQCLSYQCSEGDVPNTPLFGDLRKLINNACWMIVDGLPEMTAAEWDVVD